MILTLFKFLMLIASKLNFKDKIKYLNYLIKIIILTDMTY
jgi:hypothetical protein